MWVYYNHMENRGENMNSKTPITGIVETDNRTYAFYLDNYTLRFLDTIIKPYYTSTLKHVDGFAQAMSHNNTKVLIYIGQHDFPVVNTMKMGLSSYIVSTSNILDYDVSFYDGIMFVGGTITKLKHPRAMKVSYDGEAKKQYIEHRDDEQKIVFSTDDFNCEVTIGSSTSENHSMESNSIANETVYLEMLFDKPQKTSTVYKHYNKILEILSFLTNRENVGIEEIFLLQKNIPIGEKRLTQKVAQVFIRQDKELTQKQQYHNLEFECLGDSLGKLFDIFYKTKDRKRSYSLGFYPEDDKHDTIITNEIVRSVCSALECEVGFVKGIKNEEEAKIKALKKKIQPIIEEHKAGPNKLKEKTYSLIESSMSHWSTAAADQFKILYHMYEEEMAAANKSQITIGDAEIDAFVKYRNDITHGSYRVLDSTIAYTTHLMACLVYCCVLARIGIPREAIKQWFKDGRLLR